MTFVGDEINLVCKRVISIIQKQKHLCGIRDDELEAILLKATKVLASEPALIHVAAPVVVLGDMHGQLNDLFRWFSIIGYPPQTRILLLGDYVDRGKKSLEVITLLLSYKILHPSQVFLLRGNHECSKMNRIYGFYEELRRKRSPNLWKRFNDVFNELPLCAIVASRVLCMHGGISPKVQSWDALYRLQKPHTPRECDEGVAQDLMWSDPTNDVCSNSGFQFNINRSCSVMFDESSIRRLCTSLQIDFVCRAHEVTPKGHIWFFSKRLVTLFSAPNYCGAEGNCGSAMHIGEKLEVWFTTLKPIYEKLSHTEKQMKLLQKQLVTLEARSPDPNTRQNKRTTVIS